MVLLFRHLNVPSLLDCAMFVAIWEPGLLGCTYYWLIKTRCGACFPNSQARSILFSHPFIHSLFLSDASTTYAVFMTLHGFGYNEIQALHRTRGVYAILVANGFALLRDRSGRG